MPALRRFMPVRPLLRRLRGGERCWPAAIAARLAALALLAGFWRLALAERRLALTPRPHPATPLDLLFCAAMVALLLGGLVLGIAGAGLLREVALPGPFSARGDFAAGR